MRVKVTLKLKYLPQIINKKNKFKVLLCVLFIMRIDKIFLQQILLETVEYVNY